MFGGESYIMLSDHFLEKRWKASCENDVIYIYKKIDGVTIWKIS